MSPRDAQASSRPAPAITRVLVVEDEPRYQKLLVEMLKTLEIHAEAAGTIDAAWSRLGEPPAVEAVVLDLQVPGGGGLSLLRRLRGEPAVGGATAVVILTAFGDLDTAREAIDLEVAAFLTKPCRLGELESAMDQARRWRQTRLAPPPLPTLPGEAVAEALDDDVEAGSSSGDTDGDADAASMSLEAVEKRHILETLERHGGNRRQTAEALGISERTLYYRLAQYGEVGD